MKGKKYEKLARRILAMVFVFSLLQSHLFILNEFAGTAYAAISSIDEDSTISSLVEEIDDENDLSLDASNTLSTNESEQTENIIENLTNKEIENDDEVANEISQPDDDVVENTITDEATGDEESNVDEVLVEELKSSLEIVDAYRSLNGVIIRTNIYCEMENLKDTVKESGLNLAMPVVEGYTIENVYLEDVSAVEETCNYSFSQEGNDFVINILNDTALEEFKYKYTVVYVLNGTGEVDELSLDLEVALTYEKGDILTKDAYVSQDVNLEDREANLYSVTSQNTSIYKGYLYANAMSTTSYETKYTSLTKLEINSLENIEYVLVTEDVDVINVKDGIDSESLLNFTAFTKTSVLKEDFDKMFGKDGYIEIYSNGTALGRIDSNTVVEDGRYVYEYNQNVSNVEFKLNMIENVGCLEILNNKVIRKITTFSRSQIKEFSGIEIKSNVKEFSKVSDTFVCLSDENSKVEISLEDTESRMDLQMNVTELSTGTLNDVTFTVTLRTNEEKYELFKNPEFWIELPSDVIDVEIENIDLLYKNGLSIDSFDVTQDEFGKKIIKVRLVGTQIEYTPGLLNNGTTINLYTKITLDRLTTNKNSKIDFKYSNEVDSKLSYEVEGKESVEIPVSFISKIGLLRASSLENTLTDEVVVSYDSEVESLRLEDHKENQVIKYKGTIVNNFSSDLTNVQIIGKLPFVKADEEEIEDFTSTFEANLISPIATNGAIADVFYSEDINASTTSDNWKKDVTDFSKIKTFKIVIKNAEFKQGELLEFSCDIKVQDNLENNQRAYCTYNVHYDLDGQTLFGYCTTKMVTDEKEITMDDVPEEDQNQVSSLVIGSVVTKWQEQLDEDDTVFDRQALKYTIVVTNTAQNAVEGIHIKASAENANLYYMKTWIEPSYQGGGDYEVGEFVEDKNGEKLYEEFFIDSLKPGETKSFEYQVIVKDLKDIQNPEVFGKIEVYGDSFETLNVETIKNKIVDGDISVLTEYGATENPNDSLIYAQAPLRFEVVYTNESEKIIENAKLRIFISKELELNKAAPIEGAEEFEKVINEVTEGTIIDIIIPYMAPGETSYLNLYTVVKNFDTDLLTSQAVIYTVIEYDNNLYYSNNYIRTIYQSKSRVEYTWTADKDTDTTLVDGDVVKYKFYIKNVGKIDINELSAELDIDSGLKLRNVVFNDGSETISLDVNKYNKFVLYDFPLNVGKDAYIEYEFKVDESLLEANQSVIEARVDVTSSKIVGFTTDVISFKVKNDLIIVDDIPVDDKPEPGDRDDPDEDVLDDDYQVPSTKPDADKDDIEIVYTYKVSGKAWIDKNKDGIYSNEEAPMSGVGVSIYGVTNNSVDIEHMYGSTKTDKFGKYEFTNLPVGKYIVVFGYDSNMYTVTKYQNVKAKSNENSDAINKDLYETGNNVGITDIIDLDNKSVENIDIGLVQINDFDMELEKYIVSTTVTNSKGKTKQSYDEDDLVKLEINSKMFEDSIVEIEYKMVLKNTGELTGYANRIIDYKPDELGFDESKNKDWKLLEDGRLVYTGLMEKPLKPGTTHEIPLVLTMKIEDTNARNVVNNAEILELTNDRGFQDIDSVTGNKLEQEDDYGSVALLITVSTGRMVNYTLVIISIILIIGVLIIGRLIFKEKIYK